MAFAILTLLSCATISTFDQQAYSNTVSVKVDAMNMMDLAVDDYNTHEASVKTLLTELQKTYEYEKNRPKNGITLQLWDKLLDKNGHLLGGFLARWQTEKKLNAVYIQEAKKLVDKAFDQIAGLESKKIKTSQIE
jgi:hypothetical protein